MYWWVKTLKEAHIIMGWYKKCSNLVALPYTNSSYNEYAVIIPINGEFCKLEEFSDSMKLGGEKG